MKMRQGSVWFFITLLMFPLAFADYIEPEKGMPVDFAMIIHNSTTCADANSRSSVKAWMSRWLLVNFGPTNYTFAFGAPAARRLETVSDGLETVSDGVEGSSFQRARRQQVWCSEFFCSLNAKLCLIGGCPGYGNPHGRQLRGERNSRDKATRKLHSSTVTPEDVMAANTTQQAIAMSPFSMNLDVGFSNSTTTVYIAKFFSSNTTACNPKDLTLLVFFGDDR